MRPTRADALAHRRGLPAGSAGRRHGASASAPLPTRRCPDDPRFAGNDGPRHRLGRAFAGSGRRRGARRHGIEAVILSDAIEGEAREVGQVHAAIAREIATRDRPFAKPVLLLSGGETTVTLARTGRAAAGATASSCCRLRSRIEGVDGIHALRRRHGRDRRLARTMPAPSPTGGRAGAHARGRARPARAACRHDAWDAFDARRRPVRARARPAPTSTISARSWSC